MFNGRKRLKMTEKYSTVILADGDFPSTPRTMKILKQAERIICCDGAAEKLLRFGLEPDIIVGDLDSLAYQLRQKFADKIIHVAEQESNDLSKAFRYCRSQNYQDVVILGATGKREDHTLGNLALLTVYAEELPGIKIITDYGEFSAVFEGGTFQSVPGEQISIISLDSSLVIHSSENLKYPIKNLKLSYWNQATLNEALSDSFSLEFPPHHPVLIYRAVKLK